MEKGWIEPSVLHQRKVKISSSAHSRRQDPKFVSVGSNARFRINIHPRGNWTLDIDYWTLKKSGANNHQSFSTERPSSLVFEAIQIRSFLQFGDVYLLGIIAIDGVHFAPFFLSDDVVNWQLVSAGYCFFLCLKMEWCSHLVSDQVSRKVLVAPIPTLFERKK